MLWVSLLLCPRGNHRASHEVGTLEIANIGGTPELGDYSLALRGAIHADATLRGARRDRGHWAIVAAALEALFRDGPAEKATGEVRELLPVAADTKGDTGAVPVCSCRPPAPIQIAGALEVCATCGRMVIEHELVGRLPDGRMLVRPAKRSG